jgi:hypothetical protein
MKGKIAIAEAAIVVLLAISSVRADDCKIVNGSFEDDGAIYDIMVKEPNGWDVTMAQDKFIGYVRSDWPTDGSYNLTLYSRSGKTFTAGEMAAVSQMMSLKDVNEIIFDLKLDTQLLTPWEASICSAVLVIDNDVVWESSKVGADIRGQYLDQRYVVDDKYRDDVLHKLSLGLRMNLDKRLYEYYITRWDSIKCTELCGGGGLLPTDFNRDCFVDINDLELMAEVWLAGDIEPDDKRNLFDDDDLVGGFINLFDLAILADGWDGDIGRMETFAEKWLQTVPNDDPDNLFRVDDKEPKGLINFFDFAIFANTWLESSYIESP